MPLDANGQDVEHRMHVASCCDLRDNSQLETLSATITQENCVGHEMGENWLNRALESKRSCQLCIGDRFKQTLQETKGKEETAHVAYPSHSLCHLRIEGQDCL